jgi:small subunit ribosomal protein S15
MSIQSDKKTALVQDHRRHESDTGSAEVQVAILSGRITNLTDHLKTHPKDHSSRRGLLKLVGKRSAMLKYLSATHRDRYLSTIQKLGLRK